MISPGRRAAQWAAQPGSPLRNPFRGIEPGAIAVQDNGALTLTEFTLPWLLRAWCDGGDVWKAMHEDVGELATEGINPFTKQRHVFRKRLLKARGKPWPGYPSPEALARPR